MKKVNETVSRLVKFVTFLEKFIEHSLCEDCEETLNPKHYKTNQQKEPEGHRTRK